MLGALFVFTAPSEAVVWGERLRYAGFAKGYFDGPDAVSNAGRHLFSGRVACRQPIDDVILELDGFLYLPSDFTRERTRRAFRTCLVPADGRSPSTSNP